MDKRINRISRLLSDIVEGRFDRVLPIEGPNDELNACMIGFNILKEELKRRTVSRDYFNSIVNSVSDMVFILSPNGFITDVNIQAEEQLKRDRSELVGLHIENMQVHKEPRKLRPSIKYLKENGSPITIQTFFSLANGRSLPVEVSLNWLFDKKNRRVGLVATAKDITEQLQAESMVLRAVIDTQEQERNRLSKDLHDSLGQEISAIKMHIGAALESLDDISSSEIGHLSNSGLRDLQNMINLLNRSNTGLHQVLSNMRGICFNLMPRTLEEYGLYRAISELCKQSERNLEIDFDIKMPGTFPPLAKSIEIDIYRIIQEFINNATRHGGADKLILEFLLNDTGSVSIRLKDNGVGFLLGTDGPGMGLGNISSRVRSHGGKFQVFSQPGKGSEYRVDLPKHVAEQQGR